MVSRTNVIVGCSVFVAAVLTSIVLLAVSLKKLKSTEYGVAYDKIAKVLDDAAKQGGLHPGPPGYEFIKFPSTQISADLDDTCVSRDGLRVQFSVTYQYQMPEENIVDAIVNYRNFHKWSNVVEAAGNSAIQHTCSMFNITNFQNKRGLIQNTMMENLRLKLEGRQAITNIGSNDLSDSNNPLLSTLTDDGVYSRAISLQLKNVDLPNAYRTAVSEKQSAEEDIALAKNQRLQETTKARTELKTAEDEARKIIDNANNDASVTLTQARLKASETKFAFEREAMVLLQVKEDFNMTTEGVLAYMSNQLYQRLPTLKVSTGEPARISLKDEL